MSGDPDDGTEQIAIGPVEFWFCSVGVSMNTPDQDTVLRPSRTRGKSAMNTLRGA